MSEFVIGISTQQLQRPVPSVEVGGIETVENNRQCFFRCDGNQSSQRHAGCGVEVLPLNCVGQRVEGAQCIRAEIRERARRFRRNIAIVFSPKWR